MPMNPTDKLLGPPRGDPSTALDFAKARGAKRLDELSAYLAEVYRLAPLVGLDPAIAVAQSAHETGNWSSGWWSSRLNPCGLGVTGDPEQDRRSPVFLSGVDAARAHLVHLAVYAIGGDAHIPAALLPFIDLDTRYYAAIDAGYAGIAKTINDLTGRWATDPEYSAGIVSRGNAIWPRLPDQSAPSPQPGALRFGNVKHPPHLRRVIENSRAWNDFGQRKIVGTCVHRMIGTLWGTDGYFRGEAAGRALTDYGIGGKVDGAAHDGEILMWNDPRGRRAPWANGETDGLEGDGPAFVQAYGVNGVNRDLVSIELSGNYDTPVTAKQWSSLCWLIAYWHDQAKVPWDQFPVNPDKGVVTQMQHWEFATKPCPGVVVRNATTEYQAAVRAILRHHQTGDPYAGPVLIGGVPIQLPTLGVTPPPPPPPPPPPALTWPKGMSLALAKRIFAEFDPTGPVSLLWKAEGEKTGRWPGRDSVIWGEVVEGEKTWRFVDGLTIRQDATTGKVYVVKK